MSKMNESYVCSLFTVYGVIDMGTNFIKMADYWKSQPKKFCQYCKCWIADNKPSIEFHERGKNHKENVAAKIAEIKKKSIDKAKQEDRMSKEFAAMEEAALKAFQADLKRLGAESASAEAPREKAAVEAAAPSSCESDTWHEGVSDEGYTYYYNTRTGESQWDKPEGFQDEIKTQKQPENEKSSSCQWMEALSPDGYTYYYNTETGESSWEKPEGYSPPEKPCNSEGTAGQKDPMPPQPGSPKAEEDSSEKTTAMMESEGAKEPQVPKISFRKRKSEKSQLSEAGSEEDKDSNDAGDGDDAEAEGEDEDNNEKSTSQDDGKEEEKIEIPVKKTRKTTPYGEWEQIQEEEDPYENVDLQLPQVEGVGAAPVPSDLPPEPKVKFKERTITSLGDEGDAGAVFKKRKIENSKSRNLRQRGNDD
ncbi:hypothetical protein AGOR_G00063190 [Albula goreensis]|uniref:WW domain-binding protein 4 n=1 Tax=Albula goreensis TaxID=1534307 RepID=A0A8T3DZ45_9TELE|nr:hypothetical protein AGOR_G00063190 [Albula goreensis]